MGLSFEDSLKAAQANAQAELDSLISASQAVAVTPAVATVSAEDYSVMTLDDTSGLIAAYSGTEYDSAYESYSNYPQKLADNKISTIDEDKNIKLADGQINLTQESNSQYIPFQMPKYYDGFDLSTATLSVYWVNEVGSGSAAKPVNVSYDDDYIYFAWLVDDDVTRYAGTVKFEIQARGNIVSDSGTSSTYVWKSRSEDLNVLQALRYNEVIEPDEGWQTDFFAEADKILEDAQAAANAASESAAAAQAAATSANTSLSKVDAAIDDAVGVLEGEIDAVVTEKVADSMGEYAKTADIVDAYATKESIPTLVSELENDSDYATMTEVEAAIADADLDKYATVEYVGTIPETDEDGNVIEATNVVGYIDYRVASVDMSEQLSEYAKTEYVDAKIGDLTLPTSSGDDGVATLAEGDNAYDNVTDFVIAAMDAVDVSEELSNYYAKDETYTKEEVNTALSNVKVDLTGYATETYVYNKIDVLSTGISDNASDIQSANAAITTINQTLESIDKSPRVTYDATYGDVELDDGTTANYMFTLWKTESGVREVQDRFQIAGGGGGSSNNLKTFGIKYIEGYGTPLVTTVNDSAIIQYEFFGMDSADDTNLDGVASWKVGNRVVATEDVSTGICEFDLTEYVSVGDNKVVLTITHATGAIATKAWTVKVVDVRLESSFDDTKTHTAGQSVNFAFTPYGSVDKTVHFLLDGEEIATKTSSSAAAGLSDSYAIPAQEHGTHLFEIYMTAVINENTVESNHIIKDIIWYDESSDVPVIAAAQQTFTARQYEATNITYTVYDPSTETPSVSLKSTYVNEDGETVEEYSSNLVLDSNTQVWQYKTDVIGEHILTITCGETVKTLIATIVELGINVAPITAGLAFDFNPVGYSNNDENRLWTNGTVAMTVSDNFDWVNGGYQIDENGDQCFCIKSGTTADINYELFGDDAKSNGKQFKLIFKTKNVANGETTFLSCLSDNIGVEMKAHEATIYAETGSLPLPYAEEEIIEFEFNITPSSETPSMIMGYEDGVSTRPLVYDSTHNLQQYLGNRKIISLGSPDCDLYIYRFKVYNTSLSDRDILNNFIADARSAEEMIDRYDRNQIYKEGILDPDYLAEACPQLRIIKLDVPWFTNDKDNKVYDANRQTVIECIYKGGDPVYDNWVAYDCVHSGQGTSSNNYGPAGRNLDLILKPYKDYGNEPYIILGDGTRVNKVSLTRESIPVNYFNVKVNIASSENANNALMAKRYNTYNPYTRPFVRYGDSLEDHYTDEEIAVMTEEQKSTLLAGYQAEANAMIPYIKDTMEFQNCVVFVKESDPDLTTHREFNDNNWHFYAIGNIGDSKKTDDSRLTDPNDPYECILEVMDNTLPNSTMPTGKVDENGAPVYPIDLSEWTVGNSAYDALHADKFDENPADKKDNGLADTYGWRYIYEDGTDEENAEAKSYVENKWKEFYEFVVTSTNEEFKANLGDWCVLDSVMYYYLFTLRYTMTDNHAKNSFWHYGKTGEVDSEGNPIRKFDLCFGYDFDTCLGIDNYGRMSYRYGYEEIDYVDGTSDWVWNAPQHVFFLRLRELFDAELCELYTELEDMDAWSAVGLINQFNKWQMQWPEELWRLDTQRKYIRTYTTSYKGGADDKAYPEFLVERANGRKKTQRAQFEKNQEKYMSSKFSGSEAFKDSISLRCSADNPNFVVEPNFDMHLTPYSYVYLNVEYNNARPPIKVRAVPNQEYTISYTGQKADGINIYSGSCLKSVGDLSACYLTNGSFANATKLRELKLGSDIEGYDNTNVMTLGLGSNELLNKLDIQNMSGLTHSLELSGLKNLEELYAFGSGVSGVVFADGGNIEVAELPDVGSLQMKNLTYLDDEGFEATSYDNLTKLIAENSQLDLIDIINNSSNLRQVRLVGIDWTLDDTTLLERLYGLAGVTNTGANTDQSVLAGYIHVPTIKSQQKLEYEIAWPDLVIEANTTIEQHPVTFVNDDGTVLEVQYVDNGSYAIDPLTREDNPMSTPIKESTVSTDYAFAGWDTDLSAVAIRTARTVTAIYSESIRKYTIKYVSKGSVLQSTVAEYGTNVMYDGDMPTYTLEEGIGSEHFYLFSHWDNSGIVDGDKTVTAVFDDFQYYEGAFDNLELSDMRTVEVYALTRLVEMGVLSVVEVDDGGSDEYLGDTYQTIEGTNVQVGDPFSFTMGYDVDYGDVDSVEIISEKITFDGTNYLDTGILLFDEDKDFVLALDYKMHSNNDQNDVLMQCYQSSGSNGFKLGYNTSPEFSWGGSSISPASSNAREMLVIRHLAGDPNLYVYTSNLDSASFNSHIIAKTTITQSSIATLVLGASKNDAGTRFTNHCKGDVYWCKIWYMDLGEEACEKLVGWTHEDISLQVSGFYRYQLYGDVKESTISFVATHLLDRAMKYNNSNTNVGGWATSSLRTFLNSRFYNAIPYQIKSLMKNVMVKSTIGGGTTSAPSYNTSESGCYVAIPALYDLDNSVDSVYASEIYDTNGTIDFMVNSNDRKRAYVSGDYAQYWTRSPNVTYNYIYCIDSSGDKYGFSNGKEVHGVLIEISF